MTNRKVIMPDAEIISMNGRAAELLINSACPEAALVYIYTLKNGGVIAADAPAVLKMSAEKFDLAMKTLGRLGLVKTDGYEPARQMPSNITAPRPEPADELPEYSVDDIKREALSGNSQFAMLTSEVQRVFGKVLSTPNLKILFGIYDSLSLPPEVILQLVHFCIAENRRRYGEGKLPTMRYVEKVAYSWDREGIVTLEKAEEYIKNLEARREARAQFAAAMQIRGRELSVTERKYIDEWIAMGFTADAAAIAFDRTVTQTGRLVWKYADSIMRNWHGKGLHTAADIEKQDAPRGRQQAPKVPTGSASGPTAADIERMKKILEKI